MARRNYSRRAKTEQKKNTRKALLYIILTVIFGLAFIFFGLNVLARISNVFFDIKKSSETTTIQDTTPPPSPKIDPLPDYTKKDNIDIKGHTEAGITVKIKKEDEEDEIITNADGDFTYNLDLTDGENRVSFIAIDESGNESRETREYSITKDDTPPELVVTSPTDGSDFYGESQKKVAIKGTTEKDTKVTINGRWAFVEDEGNFNLDINLSEGENEITVTAEDRAGNQTEEKLTLTFHP